MSNNRPDFVSQIKEVESNLNAQWQSTQDVWDDPVADRFRSGTMEPYSKNFQQYLTGEGINGYGIVELMHQMEKHLQEMSSLTGFSK